MKRCQDEFWAREVRAMAYFLYPSAGVRKWSGWCPSSSIVMDMHCCRNVPNFVSSAPIFISGAWVTDITSISNVHDCAGSFIGSLRLGLTEVMSGASLKQTYKDIDRQGRT